MSIATTWGTDLAERTACAPCDDLVASAEQVLYRGITVRASKSILFRWLCQLRVAPYSYDWIDNFGRRSPRVLTPGVEAPVVGDTFMTIFRLESIEAERQLTLLLRAPATALFGQVAISYVITPLHAHSCRLLVKLALRFPRGLWGCILRRLLPWGDLFMMRRQLLTLSALSESTQREEDTRQRVGT